ITALGQIDEDVMEADATLFDPTDVHMRARGKSYGAIGNHAFRAENPSSGAAIYYALNKKAGDCSLEILGPGGEVIATLEPETSKGLHVTRWDLRKSAPRASANQGRRRFRRGGSRVQPGTYTVRMTVNGAEQSHTFQVHNDPEQVSTEWIAFEDAEEELQAVFEAHAEEADRR
ncbi:MAG: hypothetical protein AAGG01_16200, partial [Planctomycetota bacterium]